MFATRRSSERWLREARFIAIARQNARSRAGQRASRPVAALSTLRRWLRAMPGLTPCYYTTVRNVAASLVLVTWAAWMIRVMEFEEKAPPADDCPPASWSEGAP